MGLVHSALASASMLHVKVAPGSLSENVKVASVEELGSGGLESIAGTGGGVASIDHVNEVAPLRFVTSSIARTWNVCPPSAGRSTTADSSRPRTRRRRGCIGTCSPPHCPRRQSSRPQRRSDSAGSSRSMVRAGGCVDRPGVRGRQPRVPDGVGCACLEGVASSRQAGVRLRARARGERRSVEAAGEGGRLVRGEAEARARLIRRAGRPGGDRRYGCGGVDDECVGRLAPTLPDASCCSACPVHWPLVSVVPTE